MAMIAFGSYSIHSTGRGHTVAAVDLYFRCAISKLDMFYTARKYGY